MAIEASGTFEVRLRFTDGAGNYSPHYTTDSIEASTALTDPLTDKFFGLTRNNPTEGFLPYSAYSTSAGQEADTFVNKFTHAYRSIPYFVMDQNTDDGKLYTLYVETTVVEDNNVNTLIFENIVLILTSLPSL